MNWLKKFFSTTSSERNGAIILLAIITCLSIYYIIKQMNQPQINILENNSNFNDPAQDSTVIVGNQRSYFKFDPNELEISGWMELGFTEKQSITIVKYRYSLGRFKFPEELLNCYVIDSSKYFELLPYIKISSSEVIQLNNQKDEKEKPTCYAVFLLSDKEPVYDRFNQLESLYYLRDENQYLYYTKLSIAADSLENHLAHAYELGFSNARIEKVFCYSLKNITPKKIT